MRAARVAGGVEERAVIEKILGHLKLPVAPPTAASARQLAWLPGFD